MYIYLCLTLLKFIYSEKAIKFCKISILDLSYVVMVKSTVEIFQNFVAFSEYMNLKITFGLRAFVEFGVDECFGRCLKLSLCFMVLILGSLVSSLKGF